ncbi:MAG: Gfo/Idh/MocA family oxidoreductase, partial [Solirubrobacteraceae bacterium]|nr:Gfo/Idh/MocA family oxidoreductase [Solirubrobacteraceae bacterium]
APLIAATPGLELAVIVTSDADRAARAATAHPDAIVTADSDEVWQADAVVVATPNRFHASYAHEAIARGVPVIVDKPLAATAHDVDVLLADAQAANAKLTVFQNRRWDGDFLTAKALADAGTLGTLTRLTSRFERFRPSVGTGWREASDPRDGGGQLLDLGPHLIDQALLLLGPASSVYAEISRLRDGAQADDDVFLSIRHNSGARSHLFMGAVSPAPADRLTLTGSEAGFSVATLDVQEAQLRAGIPPTDPAFGANQPGLFHDEAGHHEHTLVPGNYLAFYAGVREWLAGDAPPPVDPADSAAVFAVIEAARRSALGGEVVRLDGG